MASTTAAATVDHLFPASVVLSAPVERKCLLMTIPLDVRLIIYEFAASEDKPIKPKQVRKKANKFVWGEYREEWTKIGWTYTSKEKEPLTITQLSKTCNSIYKELEKYPVFYRVNNFEFYEPDSLYKFLVAITPARRELIRKITFKYTGRYARTGDLGSNFDADHFMQRDNLHTLTMLRECYDLRELAVVADVQGPPEFTTVTTEDYLLREINQCFTIAGGPLARGFWSLPTFQLYLAFKEYGHDYLINLSKGDLSAIPSSSVMHKEPLTNLVEHLKMALMTQRQNWAMKEKQGDGVYSTITPSMRQNAFTDSQIDFPGEDRITFDKANSNVGAVSGRTRRRCKVDKVSAEGIILRNQDKSKYNKEGFIAWSIVNIEDIRVFEDGVKCWLKLRVPGMKDATELSWEFIDSIMDIDGILKLEWFYLNLHDRERLALSLADKEALLSKVEAMMPPDDVFKFTKDWMYDLAEENPRSHTTHVKTWNACQNRYEKIMQKLQKKVADEKRKAAARDAKAAKATTVRGKK